MKLDPNQVRFIAPFWPGVFRRRLRFAGRRNTVHLQETALVVDGELLRFHFLGFERFVARALCEWTTVTVPYTRIVKVKYSRKLLLRGLLVLLALWLIVVCGVTVAGALIGKISQPENIVPVVTGSLILLGICLFAFFRVFIPSHTVTFRAKDGTLTTFALAVRSRRVRKEFATALQRFRDAAAAHGSAGGVRP